MDDRVGAPSPAADPPGLRIAVAQNEWRIMLESLRHWYRLVGGASPGARVVELEEVTACVVPAAPERSVFNGVMYRSPERLAAVVQDLARTYQAAGVVAWCVWVPEGDRATAAALEGAGHVLDASPAVMFRTLDAIGRPAGDALEEWTRDADIRDAAALNDRSYGYDTDSFARGLSNFVGGKSHVYIAYLGDQPVASVVATDHRGNCEVDLVATLPEARGRGIAGALTRHALADAAERGCATTTLVASRLGRPVYERLGYRAFGTMQMWELRQPA